MRTARISAAVILLSALVLTGCSVEEGAPATDEPSGTNRPADDAPAEADDAEPAVEETTPPVTNPTFGQAYTWDDGLSLTIGAPEPFTPSEYAAGITDGATNVKFTVTIVNGTDKNFEPAATYLTVQSGNTEASQIFDSENGAGTGPSTALLPGREATFSVGFSVADPADIVMDASVGWDYDSVIYTF